MVVALWLAGALALAGCGDSDSESGGSGGNAGSGGSAGTGGDAGSGGMTGGGTPVITMVAWAPDGSCSPGTTGDYTVTVTAMDPDDDPLSYSGSVLGCNGSVDMATSTISCPNAAPYGGTVVVEDDNGNVSVPVDFTVGICESGSVEP